MGSLGVSCHEGVLLGAREAPPSHWACSEAASETGIPSLLSPSPKQPYFYKLMKRKWLSNPEAFSTIMALLAEHAQKLRRMKLGPYQVGTGRPSPPPVHSQASRRGQAGCPSRMSSVQPAWFPLAFHTAANLSQQELVPLRAPAPQTAPEGEPRASHMPRAMRNQRCGAAPNCPLLSHKSWPSASSNPPPCSPRRCW